jgi:hypothetical protein
MPVRKIRVKPRIFERVPASVARRPESYAEISGENRELQEEAYTEFLI